MLERASFSCKHGYQSGCPCTCIDGHSSKGDPRLGVSESSESLYPGEIDKGVHSTVHGNGESGYEYLDVDGSLAAQPRDRVEAAAEEVGVEQPAGHVEDHVDHRHDDDGHCCAARFHRRLVLRSWDLRLLGDHPAASASRAQQRKHGDRAGHHNHQAGQQPGQDDGGVGDAVPEPAARAAHETQLADSPGALRREGRVVITVR